VAHQLLGKPVAQTMKAHIHETVSAYQRLGVTIKLVAALVEGDAASLCYAKSKARLAKQLGIEYELHTFPVRVTEQQVLSTIHHWNEDSHVHGIMLELPLPHHLDTHRILAAIRPEKDIDGLTAGNQLANMVGDPGLRPATPLACLRLLEFYGIPLRGRDVALVGCGKTVGMPLLHLLLRKGATVTVCHASTRDIGKHLQQAEIAFVAVGKPALIQPEMCHSNLTLIDAGINETPQGDIVGDAHPDVANVVKAMTPTPGGVGVVTTMQLFSNLLEAAEIQLPQLRVPYRGTNNT
jgi:methylenetetrahydrofolate dehydrogenase (NADP+)/methenyltetrahydrofolate cyclohydrolase